MPHSLGTKFRLHAHQNTRRHSAMHLNARSDYYSDLRIQPRTVSCKDTDTCTKPTSTPTLAIVLGSLVPIVCAVVVLIWLHRRHLHKLKIEDATDKTKSMDFGLGTTPIRGLRDDSDEKTESRSRRQLSMDMDTVASPYLLPSAHQGSTHSLHSIARTVHSVEDRYGRPNTAGEGSQRPSIHRRQDSSIYASSTRFDDSPDGSSESMDLGLLGNAQRMPTSTPPPISKVKVQATKESQPSVPRINVASPDVFRSGVGLPSSPRDGCFARGKTLESELQCRDSSEKQLPTALQVGQEVDAHNEGLFFDTGPTAISNHSSMSSPTNCNDYNGEIQFRFSAASDSDIKATPPRQSPTPGTFEDRRLSIGFRPLPPEGNPDDTAEERAMRIRSFYKEYFSVEESGPIPPIPTAQIHNEYSHEHNTYADDSGIFDPETGRYVIPGSVSKPFVEPITRRAMTPPPRLTTHVGDISRAGSAAGLRFMTPSSRSYSSASGHAHLRPENKRPLEPPKPLNILPTPSKVNEDAFASPIMFAPPIRVNRDGESDSLRGGLRPYSPSVSPHNPLVSSFDELAALPTPHMLRKSGTFTGLDFAPPKKFKNEDLNDSGSIRSNRSDTSALQVHNIRTGAYRVSRIPQDVVPIKSAMADELKPTWEAHGR